MSDEVTSVVQRAMFWCSRQSIELISHSVKILIYPTLNYTVSWWSHPSPSHVFIKALTQPRIRWILISRRNIPLLHLCETWQTGSFPRLHSFDELFKSQSPDSFLPRNGQNLKTENGEYQEPKYLIKLYSPYFIVFLWLLVRALECRLLIMSMCYRKPSIK